MDLVRRLSACETVGRDLVQSEAIRVAEGTNGCSPIDRIGAPGAEPPLPRQRLEVASPGKARGGIRACTWTAFPKHVRFPSTKPTVATVPRQTWTHGLAARFLLIHFTNGRKSTRRPKQPYAVGLKDGAQSAFAGLWERWKDKATGQSLETYTIITTDPNELIEPLRMPVILPPKDYERWLATGTR